MSTKVWMKLVRQYTFKESPEGKALRICVGSDDNLYVYKELMDNIPNTPFCTPFTAYRDIGHICEVYNLSEPKIISSIELPDPSKTENNLKSKAMSEYPVGSYYKGIDSTNPSITLGFGSWVRVPHPFEFIFKRLADSVDVAKVEVTNSPKKIIL